MLNVQKGIAAAYSMTFRCPVGGLVPAGNFIIKAL